MRGSLLVLALLLAVMLSGCLVDDGDGPNNPGTGSATDGFSDDPADGFVPVEKGEDLGELAYEDTGEAGTVLVQSQCEMEGNQVSINSNGANTEHQWGIPASSSGGVPWTIERLEITLHKPNPAMPIDLDLVVLDGDGNELGRDTEQGPDADTTMAVILRDVAPTNLLIEVRACTSPVPGSGYAITGTASMVAAEDYSGEPAASPAGGTSSSGDIHVETYTDSEGNTRYEASRKETYTATLTGDSGDADIETGAGFIHYEGGNGDDYKLVATLKARGDSEQQARDRLAEMSIDHTAKDGNNVALDVEGVPGGSGWNHKQIDMEFDAPNAIDWDSFDATAGAGAVTVDDVTGTDVTLDAGAGLAMATDVTADTLDVDSGAGAATIKDSTTNSLSADAGAGQVSVENTRANDVSLDAGAGQIVADFLAPTASGTWNLDAGAGQIDLTIVETTSVGYTIDASTSAGSVTFDFDDIEETSSDCQYASCTREGKTTGYDSRSIQTDMDLDIGAGSISAQS